MRLREALKSPAFRSFFFRDAISREFFTVAAAFLRYGDYESQSLCPCATTATTAATTTATQQICILVQLLQHLKLLSGRHLESAQKALISCKPIFQVEISGSNT